MLVRGTFDGVVLGFTGFPFLRFLLWFSILESQRSSFRGFNRVSTRLWSGLSKISGHDLTRFQFLLGFLIVVFPQGFTGFLPSFYRVFKSVAAPNLMAVGFEDEIDRHLLRWTSFLRD